MSNEQPLLDCTFGWGKTCRLYLDRIEIAGKSYELDDLTSVHPSYRCVLGIPSARLELSFGLHRLVLRGIADPDVARQMVSHLRSYCDDESLLTHSHSRSSRSRNLARAQARAWERTSKLPAIPASAEDYSGSKDAPDLLNDSSPSQPPAPSEGLEESAPDSVQDEAPSSDQAASQALRREPAADTSLTPGEMLAAFAQLARGLTTPADAWPLARLQALHTPRYQPPLHSVRLVDPQHRTLDINSMPVPAVKSQVLPIIHVPVRLQPGECAHYSIGASLCSDRLSSSERAPYPPLDHGLLILTNRRIFYIGKRGQLVLAYTRLWYVSLLHAAVALHIEGQFRRIIIELEHPHEWASRIEQLAFIARRERPRSELPALALPGLGANAITLKRPAIKAAKPPLLAERISPKIVDANTVELDEPPEMACADLKTQDFPAATSETASPEVAEQPTLVDMTLQEDSQLSVLENAPTREFSLQPDLANMKTQEIPLPLHVGEPTSQELSAGVEEKTTQDLLYGEEVHQEQCALDDNRGVETSALHDPAWEADDSAEVDTLSLREPDLQDEGDSQTMPVRVRKASQARTISLKEPVSDRLPELGIIPRRIARRRVPHRPFYAREG